MHATGSPQVTDFDSRRVSMVRSQGAFSLIEVTLAIGIIAFAFVALFGLLPTGMTTFRAAVDATNDTIMMQNMNSMVQVTPWAKIDDLDANGEVYYFDEEGRRTDTKLNPLPAVKGLRLYQVKLYIEPFYEPSATSTKLTQMPNARRVIVVIGDVGKPPAEKEFDKVTSSEEFAGKTMLRMRAFIVTRMESVQSGT